MRKQGLGICAVSVLALFAAVPAFAQDADSDQKADQPEQGDIVVTANRTSSLASKTPLSLTALAGKDLARAGVGTTSDLTAQVPALTLSSNNGGLQITLRGVTNSEVTVRGDPSAAFLVDEVYMGRTQQAEVALFDMNRVEVLRGPQGTLFGRNTTAGIIHVVTNDPVFDFAGSADLTVGSWGTVQATGMINAPLSENLAIRAAVNFDMRDNYFYRGPLFTGNFDKGKKNISGRLSILQRWDSGSLRLKGDYTHLGGRPYNFIPAGNFYTGATTGESLVGTDPVYLDRSTRDKLTDNSPYTWDGSRDDYTWGIEAQANQGLGALRLFYVGSYREFVRDEEDPRSSFNAARAYRLHYNSKFTQNSQELRLATDGDGPLKAQVGALYYREKLDDEFRLVLIPNSAFLGNTNQTGFKPLINTAYGFFGQATYAVVPSVRITAGARYSHDSKRSPAGYTNSCTQLDCATGSTPVSVNVANFTSSKLTWKVGLDADIAPSTMAYFNVSTGYKAGGFNAGCELGTQPGCRLAASALYYRPETITSYEAGIKASMLGGTLRMNLSAFHYDYTDIQLTQVINDCGGGLSCSATTNGGKAKVDGVEFEGTLLASPNDRFTLNATYLNARFTQFTPRPGFDFAGKPLSNAPTWTFSPGYTHTFPFSDGGKIDFTVRSKISSDYKLLSIGTVNYYRQPGFSRTDVSLQYTAPDNRWYLQGFASNIENSVPVVFVQIGVGGRSGLTTEAPMTFGFRGGVKF